MTPEWFDELERRANEISGLSTTSSIKYDELKAWLLGDLTVPCAVCFVSEIGKQWTPRVGQALMGLPRLLVLLIRDDSAEKLGWRLSELHRYVGGLHATIVLVGDEGSWKVKLVVGTAGRALYETLSTARPPKVDSAVETSEPTTVLRKSVDRINFLELEPAAQGELIWEYLVGLGPTEFDAAIRAAANMLRDDGLLEFERLRRDGQIYAGIENAISWCTRRGLLFDRPQRGSVRAILRNPDDFTRERWRECMLNVIGEPGSSMDRDDLVRATAECAVTVYGLDMQRLRTRGRIDTGIRSAINGLIRRGLLKRDGRQLVHQAHLTADLPRREDEPSPNGADLVASTAPVLASAEETLSPHALRAMVGEIPGESEAVFMQLLETPLKTPTELDTAIANHLKEFENAFAVHQFLDLTGAEKLAADSRCLLELWPGLGPSERHLAQAAILYFVDSEEADDDFRIGGLWTDKLVMEAVKRVVLHEPPTST